MSSIILKGYMCQGLHFDSGHYVGLMVWDDHPLDVEKIYEIWIFSPSGIKKCFFSPGKEKDFPLKYYNFDYCYGADIKENWLSEKELLITSFSDGGEVELKLSVEDGYEWGQVTIEGETETGVNFIHEPIKVSLCKDITVKVDGESLGNVIDNKEIIFAGNSPLPNIPVLTECVRKLEI